MDNTILLIEDNLSDIKLTQRAFQKTSDANRIDVVNDGVQAFEYLFGKDGEDYIHELPTLILLDIKLPKVDGLEVLKRIREERRTELLPVVILTSSAEMSDIVTSYRLGANSYIRKPVNYDHFSETVQKIGTYWMMLNERAIK